MADFEHFNKEIPADLLPPIGSQAAPPAETVAPVVGTPPAETAPPPEITPDKFFEDFNKRYSTTYKSDEEIKGLFTLPSKVTEYEGKLKDHDSLAKNAEQYKKELEELKVNGTSDLLSKPRIRSAYVAEQLVAKYPDRDPDVLASVAMSNIEQMSDIEAIAKERMITVKGLTYDEARLAKLADFGIDMETKPEEWDSVAKARVKIAGAEAKERIKQLLGGIDMPKVVTKEEREASQAKFLEDKIKATTPIREIFKKFDTYKNGEFEFVVPDEFKSKLDDVFQGMFIDSGLEVNEENIATAELIKKALFVEEYLPKMLEVKEKLVLAKFKEEQDKLLNNDTPPNTATATDQGTTEDPNRPGVSKFFQSQQSNRVTKL
jgi:hypothetical protein